MANFNIQEYFTYKSVSPSSLQQDNIIEFNYRSENTIHDKRPLVLVHEKLSDRFYGVNLNYDMSEVQEAMDNLNARILPFLESEYYKKYPDNKKKLLEENKKFDKSLITEDEYKEMMRRYPSRELEEFLVKNKNMQAMRCYKYQNMTGVSKLTWKI